MNAEGRRSARANVLLMGAIDHGGVRTRVRVANLSAHGALIVGDYMPLSGTELTFRCNGRAVPSRVAWMRDQHAGLQFAEAVDPHELLHDATPPPAVITSDQRKINIRRSGFRGNQMSEEERRIVEEWMRAQEGDDEE